MNAKRAKHLRRLAEDLCPAGTSKCRYEYGRGCIIVAPDSVRGVYRQLKRRVRHA